jgi:HK97 family phage prohead protease
MTTTLDERASRAKILDVRETRRMASPLEMRTDAASGHIILEGYASTFHEYDVAGGVRGGGWVERLDKRAFDTTLAGNPDVMLLINHTDMPLARTKSGTLSLRADDHGLLVRADLDPSDPDVQRLMPKMRRGDMDEMSFAFHVRAHDWSSDYTHRVITEVDLRKGDVSVVNYGANPNTAARLTEAVGALASLSNKELMQVRGQLDKDQVTRAMQVLYAATTRPSRRASTPKKYSDVDNFADPGYLDSAGNPAKGDNGVKRYPLNSAARVRNALARFAQNKGQYTSSQQQAIMGKIQAAAAKFGIKIGDGDSKQLAAFSTPYNWVPDTVASTGQDAPYDKGFPSDYDSTLGGRGEITPGAPIAGVSAKGGYDAHDEPFGPKQLYALYLLATDQACPGGDDCPGANCPDHGTEENAMDGVGDTRGDFGGKQAAPFKKGGGREGDEDESRDDGEDAAATDDDEARDDGHDPDCDGDHDAGEPCNNDGESDSRGVDLGMAAALEKTIVTAYDMATAIDDKDLRHMLARARRQVRELQHIPAKDIDISIKLAELRSEFGDPETITVSEGLRAISKAGFADTIHQKQERTA